MTSTTPYIGSKISLISKAEIRYEGILYGIDAKESTVTLAKVTSFGTEERNAPKRIPAGSEVYEYIIFRGSDIKDLHVMPAPVKQEVVVDDPAIVSQLGPEVDTVNTTVPVGSMLAPSSFKPMPPTEYNQPSLPDQPPAKQQPLPPMTFLPPPPPTAITTANSSVVSIGESTVTTVTSTVVSVALETIPSTINSDITPVTAASNDSVITATVPVTTTTTSSDKAHKDKDSVGGRDSNKGQQSHQKSRSAGHNRSHPPTDGNQYSDGTKSSGRGRQQQQNAAVTTGNRRRPYPSQYYSRGGYNYSEYQYNDNYYAYGNQRYSDRQGWSYQGSRGGSRGGRGQFSGYRNQSSGQGGRQQQPSGRGGQRKSTNTTSATKKSIKFDGDFDFESSNAKFKKEQMEEEFKQKLKLDGRKDSDSSDVQNQEEEDVIVDEIEDGEVVESTVSEPAVYYDSSKSFFDSISCEANKSSTDRRPTRNEEKSLNSETFGYSNSRGSRNRGRNQNYGGYQGGYYSGYQGGRGYRRGGQYYASRGGNPRGRNRSTQEQS